MASGSKEELWAMFSLVMGPPPSPLIDPDDPANGEYITIPIAEPEDENDSDDSVAEEETAELPRSSLPIGGGRRAKTG